MEKEDITVISDVVLAFSTFIGVGGAIAYYMKEIRDSSISNIILVEIIYILITILTIMYVKGKIK